MTDLKTQIEEAVKKEGIDLIGFAPKERFDSLEARLNPFTVFPEGKTVIMVAKRICRGALRGVEEGTNFGDYNLFGQSWLEDEFLSMACYNLTRVLENNGWEAVPLFGNPPEVGPTGVSVRPGAPAPNVFPDFEYAAVACGLCEIGYSGVLLSREFGSRQRFQMIITDAEIEGTPIPDASVCLHCGACAKACPMGAISLTETEEIEICGKKMTVAKVDLNKCRVCKNGATPNRLHKAGKPDRIAALCNRTCLCQLEAAGVLGNRFENQFRTREAWALDEAGRYAEKKVEGPEFIGGVYTVSDK